MLPESARTLAPAAAERKCGFAFDRRGAKRAGHSPAVETAGPSRTFAGDGLARDLRVPFTWARVARSSEPRPLKTKRIFVT